MTSAVLDKQPGGSLGSHRALPALGLLLTVLMVAGTAAASLAIGSRSVPLDAIWNGDHPLHYVVSARVDRTLLAFAVGGALGMAGACMQGLTRNPLADPGILGVNAGAAFAMVLAISVLGISGLQSYLWFALLGAAAASVLVHLIASLGPDGASPLKLAIAGAALTAALLGWTNAVLLTGRETLDSFRFWAVGTVGGRHLDVLLTGLPFLLVGAILAVASIGALNALALGDDLARSLGRRLGRDRLVLGVAIVLLAGTATALAGPIGFVGLIVPHALRPLVGSGYARLVPLSLVYGGVLTTLADVTGRVVLPPAEVQVGIMTAVVGVPVFLWLLRRGRTVTL